MTDKIYYSKSEKDTFNIAAEFTKVLKKGDVVFLIGDLGMGKTTFVKGIAQALGIRSRILSPTFSLIRTHEISGNSKINTIHHVDLYRVGDKDKAMEEILKEFLSNKEGVIIIEWPKKKTNIEANWVVQFEEKDSAREIKIKNERKKY